MLEVINFWTIVKSTILFNDMVFIYGLYAYCTMYSLNLYIYNL